MSIIKISARVRRRLEQWQFDMRQLRQKLTRPAPISFGARLRRTDIGKPAAVAVACLGAVAMAHAWWPDAPQQRAFTPQPSPQLAGEPMHTGTITPASRPDPAPLPPLIMDMAANEQAGQRIATLLADAAQDLGFDAWREGVVVAAVVGDDGTPQLLVSNRLDGWQRPYPAGLAARLLAARLLAEADVDCRGDERQTPLHDVAARDDVRATASACTLEALRPRLAQLPAAHIRERARQAGIALPSGMPPHEALLRGAGHITPRDAALQVLRLMTALRTGHVMAESLPKDADASPLWSNDGAIPAVLSDRQRRVLQALVTDALEQTRQALKRQATLLLAMPAMERETQRAFAFVVVIGRRDGRSLSAAALKVAMRVMWAMKSAMEEMEIR